MQITSFLTPQKNLRTFQRIILLLHKKTCKNSKQQNKLKAKTKRRKEDLAPHHEKTPNIHGNQ